MLFEFSPLEAYEYLKEAFILRCDVIDKYTAEGLLAQAKLKDYCPKEVTEEVLPMKKVIAGLKTAVASNLRMAQRGWARDLLNEYQLAQKKKVKRDN